MILIFFLSGPYFSNFCYHMLFFLVQINFLSLKLIIQISYSLKDIIIIIKPHYKFTIDINQIIDKHIQIHSHIDYILI